MFDRIGKTYRKLIFAIISLLLFSYQGNSQSFAIKQFNIEDGLSGNTVYDIYQDSLGYMWFGTDHGLSQFDGVAFKNYNSPLLANADVLVIKEMLGSIYFFTLGQELYYLQNDHIHIADPDIFPNPVGDFIEDKNNDLIWFYSDQQLFSYNYKNGKKKQFPFNAPHHFSKAINKTKDGKIWIYADSSLITVGPQTTINEYTFSSDLLPHIGYPDAKILTNQKMVIYGKANSTYIFDGEQLAPFHIPISEDERVISIELINDEWWISNNENIHILNANNEITKINSLLDNVVVNKIFSDNNDNIWLGTKNNGVFLINNLKIRNYTNSNSNLPANQIQKMTLGADNSIWLGIEKGWISKFKENQFQNYNQKDFSDQYYDLDFINNELYITANEVYTIKDDEIKKNLSFSNAKSLCFDNENIWLGTGYDVIRVNKSENIIEFFDNQYRSYAVECLNENIWLGSIKGLLRIDRTPELTYHEEKIDIEGGRPYFSNPSKGVFREKSFPTDVKTKYDGYFESDELIYQRYYDSYGDSINDDIRRIAFTSDSSIWMSTNNAGLHYIKNDVIHQFNIEDGLISNSCNDLFIDSDDNVWVATTNGLSKIAYPSLTCTNYTTDDGILSNWITSVARTPDSILYIGTNLGLSVVHLAHLRNSLSPIPIHFRNVKINEKDTLLFDHYELDFNKNNLAIDFMGISFSSEVAYQYRINDNWSTIHDHRIGLPELAPGSYDLEVSAHAANGAKSVAPIKLSIVINPPWWKTTWFSCLLLLSTILLTYWWVARFKKKEREKTAINKQFAELELQALQAQMNPHFVFNAMGAIQYFILKKDQAEANHYLTSFSKLMRLFLDSSREKYISLKDEISLLELYLKIEKLRFDEKLNYTINWDPNLPLGAIEIPSMLIQPFVENAINHGLIYKESDGMLNIDFQMNGPSTLCCTITDNGIGRAEANKRKKDSIKSYKSRATSIVNDRLRTLNIIEETKISINIKDRLDEFGNVTGTIVKILNPLLQ